jgi:hypothetical protein
MFRRDWTTRSNFVNYSRINSEHNWGHVCDRLLSSRIFTLIRNKIFTWTQEITRKATTAFAFGFATHLVLNCVFHILGEVGYSEKVTILDASGKLAYFFHSNVSHDLLGSCAETKWTSPMTAVNLAASSTRLFTIGSMWATCCTTITGNSFLLADDSDMDLIARRKYQNGVLVMVFEGIVNPC